MTLSAGAKAICSCLQKDDYQYCYNLGAPDRVRLLNNRALLAVLHHDGLIFALNEDVIPGRKLHIAVQSHHQSLDVHTNV